MYFKEEIVSSAWIDADNPDQAAAIVKGDHISDQAWDGQFEESLDVIDVLYVEPVDAVTS